MWFWLSIIAIIFWSGSDLFSKMGSESSDKLSHWKIVIAVGGVMGIHAVIEIINGVPFKFSYMLTYLPASALYILSMILGYVGLRYIELSVSTPVCNSSGAVACILFLLIGEKLSALQAVGIILIVIGVVSLAWYERKTDDRIKLQKTNKKYTHSIIAITFPILYCIIDALGTFADSIIINGLDGKSGQLTEDSANVAYELTFLAMAIFAVFYIILNRKKYNVELSVKSDLPKLVGGVFETAGQVAYINAISEKAVTAAPLISSYCIFSVVWARLILKEKLKPFQYVVIALAVAGIVILGMNDA